MHSSPIVNIIFINLLMEEFHENVYGTLLWIFNGKENREAGTICFGVRIARKTENYKGILVDWSNVSNHASGYFSKYILIDWHRFWFSNYALQSKVQSIHEGALATDTVGIYFRFN